MDWHEQDPSAAVVYSDALSIQGVLERTQRYIRMTKFGSEHQTDILIYEIEDGNATIATRLDGETLWLSLNQLVELYRRDKSVISRHIRNIFDDGELSKEAVVAGYATTAASGTLAEISA